MFKDEFRRQRVFEKRRAFASRKAAFNNGYLPALPPSPPMLSIAPPPFMPMLPPPPTYMRDLINHHHNLDNHSESGLFLRPYWIDTEESVRNHEDHHSNGIDIPVQLHHHCQQ